MKQLFISDLHLDESAPAITEFFFLFLKHIAPEADRLFVLGDFFEAWIGDDEQTPLQIEVANRLAALANQGTEIFLMHGNRDFLIGHQFAEQCGAKLLDDPIVIDINGRKALISHGDYLCIDDKEYMKFRGFARSSAWQEQVLSRPLADRKKMAEQMRQLSMAKNQQKAAEIMDVNQEEVKKALCEHGVDLMIHGHTHRPMVHTVELDDKSAQRIVLGDWHDSTNYILAEDSSIDLIHLNKSDLN
ncbi:UDP-2,3-diacylglucosamine diphosphatase [Hahella sp. CCB-MM4]|uniref:UDP-2,3-diacylglucosamine diphosphatase n=1 Tax=Hahella sp. (strain CCB-MM4) TaxID=1926491 RepID=UPI000B9B6F55|nr:UDP-2,3-diacylglucosamine diphosphatase [Hahella sp. CCB-MM4]OZG71292.1 UDP-2,3-diacylglucosamine diphosphatase [Hahella sp. CCB-MM4]